VEVSVEIRHRFGNVCRAFFSLGLATRRGELELARNGSKRTQLQS